MGLCGRFQVRWPNVDHFPEPDLSYQTILLFLEWINLVLYVRRFESCWPALMKDSNGVVIVFNPDVPSHLKEIETWHNTFISSQGLLEPQCLLIAHHKPGSRADTNHPPLGNLSSLYSISVSAFKVSRSKLSWGCWIHVTAAVICFFDWNLFSEHPFKNCWWLKFVECIWHLRKKKVYSITYLTYPLCSPTVKQAASHSLKPWGRPWRCPTGVPQILGKRYADAIRKTGAWRDVNYYIIVLFWYIEINLYPI